MYPVIVFGHDIALPMVRYSRQWLISLLIIRPDVLLDGLEISRKHPQLADPMKLLSRSIDSSSLAGGSGDQTLHSTDRLRLSYATVLPTDDKL